MARVQLSPPMRQIRGQLDGWVYKAYGPKLVLSRCPDMSGVRPSAAQRAHRRKFRAASGYAQAVAADPRLSAEYAAEARRRRLTVRTLAIRDYFSLPVLGAVAVSAGVVRVAVPERFEVYAVRVRVQDAAGREVDAGEARVDKTGWSYRAQLAWTAAGPLAITVEAWDRAGNRTEQRREWPGR